MECHVTTWLQWLSADAQQGLARVYKSTEYNDFPNFWCGVGSGDMQDVDNVDDCNTWIIGCNLIEVMYTSGNGFDREEGVVIVIMVHGAALLPVFLILQIEAHAV